MNNTAIPIKITKAESWRKWTRQDKMQLRVLFNSGRSDEEMARELNRSVGAVKQQRSNIGATKFRKTKRRTPAAKAAPATITSVKIEEIKALKITQEVLKSLGYKLALMKLEK